MEREMTESKKVENGRRRFLNISLGLALSSLAAATIYPILRFFWPLDGSAIEEKTLTIASAEIPVGKAKTVRYQGKPTVVIRTSAKEVFALSAICTHLGCIVEWQEENKRLACPCHAAYFDIHGNVISGPAPKPLPSYKAEIIDNQILIGRT